MSALDKLPWPDASVDAVICSAVLHFADDTEHFGRMVREVWRVLAPGGLLFARLASNIGLESLVGPGGRRVRLPDGSDRFIVDEAMLMDWTGAPARASGRSAQDNGGSRHALDDHVVRHQGLMVVDSPDTARLRRLHGRVKVAVVVIGVVWAMSGASGCLLDELGRDDLIDYYAFWPFLLTSPLLLGGVLALRRLWRLLNLHVRRDVAASTQIVGRRADLRRAPPVSHARSRITGDHASARRTRAGSRRLRCRCSPSGWPHGS